MKIRIPVLTLAIYAAFSAAPAHALELPTQLQKVIGETIALYGEKKGLAPNDPRIYKTAQGVSKVFANQGVRVAAGAAVGTAVVGTSPGWLSILAGIAITTGLSYAIDISADGIYRMVFQGSGVAPVIVQVMDATKPTYDFRPIFDASATQCAYTPIVDFCLSEAYKNNPTTGGRKLAQHEIEPLTCLVTGQYNPTLRCTADYGKTASTTDEAMKQADMFKKNLEPVTTKPPGTMEQAVQDMTDTEKKKPISPEAVHELVKGGIKLAAADEEYEGLPYDPPAMPTPEEIKRIIPATEPPLVEEAVAPKPNPETDFSPAMPGTSTGDGSSPSPATPVTPDSPNPGTIEPPKDAVKVDLGDDPVVGSPRLESTPTVPMILDPVMNLFPSFKSFAVPAHTAACPTPTFTFFGKEMLMDGHCTLAEANRDKIFAFMLAAYAISAVVIVMRA